LQVEYPNNIHLIRGNHEAADINALFGFRIECIERMVRNFIHGKTFYTWENIFWVLKQHCDFLLRVREMEFGHGTG